MDSGHLIFTASSGRGNNMFCLGNGDSSFRSPVRVVSMEEALRSRPFFSSPEELEEDYYDEQLPEKKRRLTPDQVHLLEWSFEAENKLEPERKTELAKKLGLQPRQVAVWFQNRRARWKTKQLEMEYDLLKASYESLLVDHGNITKENEKLKAEVVSLTEKLQGKEMMNQKTSPVLENAESDGVVSSVTVENPLSSGSGIVDEDGPQLIDSSDSYFPDEYRSCIGAVDGVQSEEEVGSDDGQSYFSDVFATAEQAEQAEDETLGWWVWS